MEEAFKDKNGKISFLEIEWSFIEEMAKAMNANKHKYNPFNWHKPMVKTDLEDSVMRHWVAYKKGEFLDPDDGCSHLAKIANNLMMLMYQHINYPENNQNPQKDVG